MRHLKAHRKLGRTSSHRRALLRNLVQSLFLSKSGRIKTTVEKAKEARRLADRMITIGKRDLSGKIDAVHARRHAAKTIPDKTLLKHLFDDIVPQYVDRPGGYTRILRIGRRPGDNAEMAFLELVGIAEEAQKAASSEDKGAKPDKDDKKEKVAATKTAKPKSKPGGQKASGRTKSPAKKTMKKAAQRGA